MSGAPEHMAPTVTVGISGVRIRFEAAEADLRIRVTFPRTRFVDTSDKDADCVVRVRLGQPKLESPPTFVSGGPWELYEGESGGDRLAIFTGLPSGGREPVMHVDLTPALDRADLTAHHRYAPGRTFVVGYPLDEYLTARMLVRRGAVIVHASTVSAEGRDGIGAYVFAGHSGAGKSTMASIAEQSGFRVLSDDRTVLSVDRPCFPPPARLMTNREPYVKPVMMQLHYATEPGVAMAQACKGDAGGTLVLPQSCKTTLLMTNCNMLGS